MTPNNESQTHSWGMIVHLASLIWLPLLLIGLKFPLFISIIFLKFPFLAILFPFLNILGPLVVWLAKKNQHPLIDDQGKESINFQISFTIWSVVLRFIFGIVTPIFQMIAMVVLSKTVSTTGLAGAGILFSSLIMGLSGLILLGLPTILGIGLVIFASVKAYKGQLYRYPFTIRFLR